MPKLNQDIVEAHFSSILRKIVFRQ